MALTSGDLNQIKNLLTDFVTKDDLKSLATKDDLRKFATKDDLKPLATKLDLDRLETRLTSAMSLLERDSFTRLDDHEARLRRLEQAR